MAKVRVAKRKAGVTRTAAAAAAATAAGPQASTLTDELSQLIRELAPEAEALGEDWVTDPEAACKARKKGKKRKQASVPDNAGQEEAAISQAPGRPKKARRAARPAAPAPAAPAAGGDGGEKDGHAARKDACEIHLSNLPWEADGDTVRRDFAKFGQIKKFFFKQDADGKSLGKATIFYSSPEERDKVLLLDNIEYKGREIRVRRRSPRRRSGVRTRAATRGRDD